MKKTIYNCFAKYLSGYINFHDTDKKWDQPQQQTKESTYELNLVFSLEKARWKYFKTMSKIRSKPCKVIRSTLAMKQI